MRYKLLFLLIFIKCAYVYAQWSDYYFLGNCTYCGYINDIAFAGNNMGFTIYNITEKSVQKCTKTNYLSDVAVSVAKACDKYICVGYENGNIDFFDIDNYSIENIPELKNNDLYSVKAINDFYEYKNYIYASTKCGIFVIDKQKLEIKNHYKITNENCNVFSVSICNEYIYASTDKGLYKANVKNNVLEDQNQWHLVMAGAFSTVVTFDNDIIMSKGNVGTANTIMRIKNDKIDTLFVAPNMRSIDVNKNQVAFAYNNSIVVKNTDYKDIVTLSSCNVNGAKKQLNIRKVCFAGLDKLVVADYSSGIIVTDFSGNASEARYPSPSNNNCYDILTNNKGLFCSVGGVNSAFNNMNKAAQLHSYIDGKWSSYTVTGSRDLLNICKDPNQDDSIYVESWGNGIFKIEDGKLTTQYTAGNSALQDIFGGNAYVRVGGIAYDNESNLYMTNSEVTPGIVIKTPTNEWYGLSYQPTNNLHSVKDMIFTKNNNCWICIPLKKKILVFNTNNTIEDDSDDMYKCSDDASSDPRYKGLIKINDSDGNLITDNVQAIVEDKNGQIWLGTNDGVLTFNDDKDVFEISQPVFNRIKVPRNDGTNSADYLLSGVTITSLAVDGANRKWIGTATDGVYLVSPDGLETIKAYNKFNSPLPTNEINSIAIDPLHGEVYIATAMGLVSIMSDAIEPEEKMSDIKVYPNPVVPTYNGMIKIVGFEDNVSVSITDINGRMVYENISLGGMIQWNGQDAEGSKVSSGTYIIWATNTDGKRKTVGKILIIR